MKIPFKLPSSGRVAAVALAALLAAACSSNPGKDRPENPFKTAADTPGGPQSPLNDRELRQQAAQLYRHAREALANTDYTVAIQRYDALIARYPFSDYSTQAELEKIYAQYKAYQADEAVAAADRFLRAHPRNVYADYVMYLKGVTDFERDSGLFQSAMPSTAKRDIGNQRRSFEDFAALLQRYPKSRYAGDARRRMLYSRNRIADHELSVAQFYVSRGAYVAAANRATDIITEYPGAPATAEALKILQHSYTRAGLDNEAKDTAAVIAMSSDQVTYTDAPKPGQIKLGVTPTQDMPPALAAQAAAAPEAQVAAAPGAQAAPPPPGTTANGGVAADSGEKPGLISRFNSMFGFLDSSKPENQHTFVIGNGGVSSVPSSPTSGAAAVPAAAQPGNGAAPAAAGTATTASAGSTPGNSNTSLNGSGSTSSMHLSVEYPDAPSTAPAATTSAAPPQNANQPEAQQQDKPGFFTWFAGLFSVFDRTEHDPAPTPVPAPSPAPAPASAAPGSTSNADTTK